MHRDRTSLELLAHFDRPPALGAAPRHVARSTRDVRWVLTWFVGAVVLAICCTILADFAYVSRAERDLRRAAHAGAVEAMLPRATSESVRCTARRRLDVLGAAGSDLRVDLLVNGAATPQHFRIQLRDGDRITIIVSAEARTFSPAWINKLAFWRDARRIEARCDRQMPDRRLALLQG